MAPRLTVGSQLLTLTPRLFGVNVEVQDYHDRSNLWDWLADSGASCVRTFHPEQTLRRAPVAAGSWGPIPDRDAFADWRQRLLADPTRGPIDWSAYRFNEPIPWMGVPDGFVPRYKQIGIEPMLSLGYGPKLFERSLVKDLYATEPVDDDGLDWEAVASAYEYDFAVIYHFAVTHGVRYFLMINEPEWQSSWFYLPDELAHANKANLIKDASHQQMTGEPVSEQMRQLFRSTLAVQWEALARVARLAIDDVRQLMAEAGTAADLVLVGPTSNQLFEPLAEAGGEHMDVLNYHCYDTDPAVHRDRLQTAIRIADTLGDRPVACSEFNLYPGPVAFEQMLFNMDRALDQTRILMDLISAGVNDGPTTDFLTLYLFAAPSTHRNFKHLVYGDMNMLDWTVRDQAIRSRGELWYPGFEELQIRHATPAYAMFRMMARASGSGGHVMAVQLDSARDLHAVAVDHGAGGVLTICNHSVQPVSALAIEPGPLADGCRFCITRLCDLHTARDGVTGVRPVAGDNQMSLPPKSVTQLIWTPLPLDDIADVRIVEQSITPGSCSQLRALQTTRLRAVAALDGESLDITDLCCQWTSTRPGEVAAYSGGLIQRLRGDRPVDIQLSVLPTALTRRLTIH